ncbi:hypothetical protein C0J52_21329 [Blattella germanica]|nr:hypothetical protein C0J52_21329 [Blattella germanica]
MSSCVRIVLSDIPSAAARLSADLLGLRMADKRTRSLFSGVLTVRRGPGGDLSVSEPTVRNVVYQDDLSTAKPLPGVLLQAFQSIIESNNSSGGTGLDISALLSGSSGFVYTTSNRNNGGGRKRDLGDEIPAGKFTNSPYVYSILFPVIDTCTVEIPSKEATNVAFLQHSQYLLTQQLSACKNSNLQNQTDLLTHRKTGQIIQVQTTATDLNDTLVETRQNLNQENLDQNNISHAHHEGHRKEDYHSIHPIAHINPQEELSLQDTPHEYKLRHSRHKHRTHNNNNHFGDEILESKNDNEEHDNKR